MIPLILLNHAHISSRCIILSKTIRYCSGHFGEIWHEQCCSSDIPEGWRWVIVKWWRYCAIWSSLSSCVCYMGVVLCLASFSIWNSLSCLCCGEMLLILCSPVPVLPGLWSSSCSPFLSELTEFSAPQNFTPILLQHSHCLPGRFGCLSAFSTCPWPHWANSLYLTHFRSSLADAASSPSYFLKWAEWLTF